MVNFKPKIIGFLCHWCSYEGADSAGRAGKAYPANLRFIRVMCSGRVDPQFVIRAFREGADGILILGCHPGDCHHREGNYYALRRYTLLRRLLEPLGIEQARLKLDWISASEGDKFVRVVTQMVDDIKALGPLAAFRETVFVPRSDQDAERMVASDAVRDDSEAVGSIVNTKQGVMYNLS
jgi:F420-non-reducing hydrogenase iron-sulfur subunit